MERRLKALREVDPLSVPLPNGTEIVTRVDRAWEGGRVPMGAVGRVLSSTGDRVLVRLIGVGELTFVRHEIAPRKLVHARRARRRIDDWEALRPCTVLECIVGSRAWGLADEGSDTDVRGVFVLPHPWTTGILDPPRDLASADGTIGLWEMRKTVNQALRADPNTLEMLFLPGSTALDPMGQWLLDARHAFVSAAIHGSFGRYALSQLSRLSQARRLVEHRELVLGWLREDPDLTLDATAQRLATSCHAADSDRAQAVLRAKEQLKQLYRSLDDQGLLPERSFPALKRLALDAPQLEVSRELRPKNAYNLLRLIHSAIHWLREGEPSFEVTGAFRDELLRVKRGEVPIEDVVAAAEAMAPELEEARTSTRLPREPDLAAADSLLRRIGDETARRWLARTPGPHGADAPEPPAVEAQGQASEVGGDE